MIVALDPIQNGHADFSAALTSHHGPLVISPFVVAELDYMIARDYGRADQQAFIDQVAAGAYRLATFGGADFRRARDLMDEYDYLSGFGIADASNVVLAELYRTGDILTTDQRDFRRVQLPGGQYFRILPYDL